MQLLSIIYLCQKICSINKTEITMRREKGVYFEHHRQICLKPLTVGGGYSLIKDCCDRNKPNMSATQHSLY